MAMSFSNRAVFLDKDGTLIRNVPYNVDPKRVELTFGAAHALQRLASRGFRLFVVSNQPGIAMGKFSLDALTPVEERIQQLLGVADVAIDGFYYCPHLPNAVVKEFALRCACRKPRSGLLRRAEADWDIDLRRSWMIGDILDDVEAGKRAGCRTILLTNGNETEWRLAPQRIPDHHAHNLSEAVRLILAAESRMSSKAYVESAHASGMASGR
jgi:D-glycero-D-manno-heptose 1,7-bisphosphate phosphatase